jgi:hypothetical protein
MNNAELFYFLGKCLTLGDNSEKDKEVIELIVNKKVDWNRFVSMASDHLVLSSVFLRFRRNDILRLLPEELTSHLQLVYELNYKRNKGVLEQIDRINRLFATDGIVPIYLKGAGNLLDRVYEDEGERIIGDIDLLVSDTEFLRAANLLKGEGYEHFYKYYDDDQWVTKHFPRLVHPTEPLDVEIHRLPVDTDLATYFNYSVIKPEIKLVDIVPPCYVLSDRHKVTLNFMHGFMAKDEKIIHMITFRNINDLILLSHRVDVYAVFAEEPQYLQQALIYADFCNHSTGNTPQPLRLKSKRFIKEYESLLISKNLFRFKWLVKYLASRIWNGYLYNLAGMFYSKQIRRSVFRRLGNRSWYKRHLKSYTDRFKLYLFHR